LLWSQDGRRLLLFAEGSPERPCPVVIDLTGTTDIKERSCWQVLDTVTGKIIWNVSDSVEGLIAELPQAMSDIELWHLEAATLSPDGQRVALTLRSGGLRFGFVVNVETGAVVSAPFSFNWRWAALP
jgi:hypothetical protein